MYRENIYTLDEVNEVGRLLSASPPRLARATFLILLGLVTAVVTWSALSTADQVAKARGVVRSVGDLARIQVERAGTLVEVAARPGQKVSAGEVLVRLDESLLRVEYEKLARAVEAKRRELTELGTLRKIADQEAASEGRRSGADLEVARAALTRQKIVEARRLEEKRAAEALARENHTDARRAAERGRRLAAGKLLAQAELESLETALRSAAVRLASAERLAAPDASEIDLTARRVVAAEEACRLGGYRTLSRLQELQLRTATAAAELSRIEKDRERVEQELARCIIRAPIDGVVVDGEPQVGDVVEPGTVLYRTHPRPRVSQARGQGETLNKKTSG